MAQVSLASYVKKPSHPDCENCARCWWKSRAAISAQYACHLVGAEAEAEAPRPARPPPTDTAKQIFQALAEYGQLSQPELQQHTRLSGRQLRHALTTLLQQHVLLYTTDDGIAFYHVDWRNAYHFIRHTSILSVTKERYGEAATKIVTHLTQLGHARVGDLAQAFGLASDSKRPSGVDSGTQKVHCNATGAHKTADVGNIPTLGRFHATLRTLLKAGLLKKVAKRSYLPAADLNAEIEEAVIREQFPDRKITGPRKQSEYRSAVNSLKRKWREANDYSDHRDLASSGGTNRPGNPSAKRMKLNGALPNGVGHHDASDADESLPKLPNDMVVRVNYAQYNLALRSRRLKRFAEPYLGGVTAAVYGALLQALESKLKARDDYIKEEQVDEHDDEDEDDRQPTASVAEVAEILDPTIDLTLGILGGADDFQLSNGTHRKPKTHVPRHDFSDIIKQEADDDEDHPVNGYSSYHDRHQRLAVVEEHLKLLEEHPKGFCLRVGGGGGGEWRVNFCALAATLVQAEIDSTVLSRFGRIHTRFVRLLRERGRLNEQQIGALCMVRVQDARAFLTQLKFAGLLQGQEIAKDSTRQPGRCLYLWFHDQERVASTLLERTYQGMARTLQRLKAERESYKNVIKKADMLDKKPESLVQTEREALMQWREVEERLVSQVERMDEMVALFRDFSGKDTSLVS